MGLSQEAHRVDLVVDDDGPIDIDEKFEGERGLFHRVGALGDHDSGRFLKANEHHQLKSVTLRSSQTDGLTGADEMAAT